MQRGDFIYETREPSKPREEVTYGAGVTAQTRRVHGYESLTQPSPSHMLLGSYDFRHRPPNNQNGRPFQRSYLYVRLAKTPDATDAGRNPGTIWQAAAAHGVIGGVLNERQGGKFAHGFVSAGMNKAVHSRLPTDMSPYLGGVVSAVVGGTISELSGGKFANGAVTSAFSYALSNAGRGGGADEGGATTCALGECPALPGEQLIAGPLEYLTPTRVWFQAGPGITYVDGYSWLATWSGAAAGERAAQYWADLHVQTGNPLYAVPGVFVSLWTPDTAAYTAVTLGAAGGASIGVRFGREITFGKNFREPSEAAPAELAQILSGHLERLTGQSSKAADLGELIREVAQQIGIDD